MQQQGSGGVVKTAYQRWKEAGRPRPYANEAIAVERFDFFALASLLLAVALLGWWIHSVYTVAFPSQKKVPIAYSRGGGSIFGATPTPAPMPTPWASGPEGGPPGGDRTGGSLWGGTRPGGSPGLAWALMAVGAAMMLIGFLGGYLLSTRYRIVRVYPAVRGGSGRVADGAV